MARVNKIKEMARERGISEDWLVLPLVNRGGQALAARELKVSQATISKWLEDNRYINRAMWQKDATLEDKADILAAHDRVNAALVADGRPTLEDEDEGPSDAFPRDDEDEDEDEFERAGEGS